MKGQAVLRVRRCVWLCVVFLMLAGSPSARAAEPYECRAERTAGGGYIVTLNVNSYSATSVQGSDGVLWTAFRIAGAPNTLEQGSPSLPYVAKLFSVPYAGTSVRVLEAVYEELPFAPPLPARGSVVSGSPEAKRPLEAGGAYSDTAIWPCDTASLRVREGSEDELRLLLFPFRYNAKSGKVLFARRMVVELQPSRGGVSKPLHRDARSSRVGVQGKEAGRGLLLVIYAKEFEETMADFLHFKRMAGLDVKALSFDARGGADLKDTAEIRKQVKAVYNASPDALRYVLLVGNFGRLPSRKYAAIGGDKTVSDWLYSPVSPRYGGGQVSFGRLPAETDEELRRMFDKVERYELGDIGDDAALCRALGIASGEKDVGYATRTDAQHIEYLGKLLKEGGYQQVDNLLDDSTGVKVRADDVVRAVNRGVGLVNYIGHGLPDSWKTSGMVTEDALRLKNDAVWPLVISGACDNGIRRTAKPSFAEGWLLAHEGNAPTGAIAFTGATGNILWEEPMFAQEQMIIALLRQGMQQPILTLGDIFTHGIVKMIEAYGGGMLVMQSADVWLLFGDPSVPFRTRQVQSGVNQLPQTLVAGMRALPVQCAEEGSVVSLCRVRKGAAPQYAHAVSIGGRAMLTDLDLLEGDTVELAIVRANAKMVWVKNIPVVAGGASQLIAYPHMKIFNQTQQKALESGGRLELSVDVLASNVTLAAPLTLYLETTPPDALELLPESSELRLPPLGAGEALKAPLRFVFRVKECRGVTSVRLRLLVDGVAGKKVLVDETIPYRAKQPSFGERAEHLLLVSPNPSPGAVQLQVKEGIARVRLFTLSGLCVLDAQGEGLQDVQLDLSHLASGVYIVVVESSDASQLRGKVMLNR